MPYFYPIVKILKLSYSCSNTKRLGRGTMEQSADSKILERLNQRLNEIDGLIDLNFHDTKFLAWKTSLESLGQRLEPKYNEIIRSFSFWPNRATWGDEDEHSPDHVAAYRNGLEAAKVQLGVIIEELEDFGFGSAVPAKTQNLRQKMNQPAINMNFILTQSQATSIQQEIGLSNESAETQALVLRLHDELKKTNKDESAIGNILRSLIESSTPIVIKMLLAHFGLTTT